jgi:probable F420-dependent oxidoreductase
MKFSISMSSGTDRPISAADIAAYGVMAEKLGYHAVYMTDHYYHLHANYHSLGAAAVIAAATNTIKIGFSAYQAPLRHPVAAAKELAHLDALCSGRLIAGLAAGSYKDEFDAFGLPFKKRGAMLGESLEIYKLLWTQDNVSFDGEFWTFENVTIAPKPVQNPFPPIWIGTWTAAPRAARRVAEHASGWQASGLHTSVADLSEGWTYIEKACDEIGRNPAEIGRAYVNGVIHFAETEDKAWSEFTRHSNRNRERDLCFMGNSDDIADRIEALRHAGVQEVSFLLGVDAVSSIETIATEIMPRFSETPD